MRGFRPNIELNRSPAEDFLASKTGEAGETVVDVEVRTIRENIDGESVGAGAEGGGKQVLGVGKGAFGFEKFLRDAALLAISEDETDGRTDKGGDDREPREGKLLARDGAAQKENQKRDYNREAVSDGEVAKTGDGFGDGTHTRARPNGGKKNNGKRREEKNSVGPTGGAESGIQG